MSDPLARFKEVLGIAQPQDVAPPPKQALSPEGNFEKKKLKIHRTEKKLNRKLSTAERADLTSSTNPRMPPDDLVRRARFQAPDIKFQLREEILEALRSGRFKSPEFSDDQRQAMLDFIRKNLGVGEQIVPQRAQGLTGLRRDLDVRRPK